jgi:hypothetical protein
MLSIFNDNTVAQAEVMNAQTSNVTNKDYTNLFDTGHMNDDELNIDVFSTSPENTAAPRKRIPSSSQGYQKPTYFNLSQQN